MASKELEDYISNLVCVPIVGGEGRRLRPFTNHKPKALLPVGIEKKPMLEYTLLPWIKIGVKKFVMCTGYMSGEIEKHFGNGSKFGIHIDYSKEEKRLKTGGAIKNAIDNKKLPKDRPVVIFYADDFIKLDIKDFIKTHLEGVKNGFKATLVATTHFRADYGLMETSETGNIKKVSNFEEKPLIKKSSNAGIYLVEPEVLELIEKGEPPFKFERLIIPKLIDLGWLMIYEINWEDWMPVNTDKDYEKILQMNLDEFYSS
jgi:NDP-sugar pyrophosphorylase family protein